MKIVAPANTALRKLPTWLIYLAGLAHIVFLFYLGQTGGLGPEPINALERELGEMGLKLIIAGLAITPLLKLTRLNLIKFRRAIGLTAFLYILVHLLVWLLLDVFLLSEIWADILKRPYITVGMAGFVALLPLAITSNDWSVRRLGSVGWRKLHKLTYVAAVLGAVHFVMLAKGWQIEPLAYLMVIVLLLALRIKRRKRADGRIAGENASA
jgi:sulfoxide reductase heme-binding subunit YedZ